MDDVDFIGRAFRLQFQRELYRPNFNVPLTEIFFTGAIKVSMGRQIVFFVLQDNTSGGSKEEAREIR